MIIRRYRAENDPFNVANGQLIECIGLQVDNKKLKDFRIDPEKDVCKSSKKCIVELVENKYSLKWGEQQNNENSRIYSIDDGGEIVCEDE